MTMLMTIEQEIARRCGPFLADVAYAPDNSYFFQSSKLALASLASSLGLGDPYTGVQWVLRRGWLYGNRVGGGPNLILPVGLTAYDRQRRIASYDSSNGALTLDRTGAMAIAPGEQIEVMALDPTQELRVAALAGLDRCFIDDRVTVTLSSQANERNITAVVPWITQKGQIQNIQWNYPGSISAALDVPWWDDFLSGGHVWLSTSPDPFPNTLLITARRPARSAPQDTVARSVSLVNFTTSTVTSAGHGFLTSEQITLAVGNAFIDGTYTITVRSADTFTLNGRVATAGGDTVVNGTATPLAGVILPSIDTATGLPSASVLQDFWDYPVSVDYAAAAGVCEAWKRFPAKLQPQAQIGLIQTQAMAAAELTRQSLLNYHPTERRTRFDTPFPKWSTVQRA